MIVETMFSGLVNGLMDGMCQCNALQLKLMATVHQTQPTIQLLLSTQEFVGALDLISTTQEVLTQELAGVHSFR